MYHYREKDYSPSEWRKDGRRVEGEEKAESLDSKKLLRFFTGRFLDFPGLVASFSFVPAFAVSRPFPRHAARNRRDLRSEHELGGLSIARLWDGSWRNDISLVSNGR